MTPDSPKGPESEAQIEIKRLEENEGFLERAVHLVLGCCDASDVPCEERDAEALYAHVRSGTTPTTQRALSGLLRGMAAKTSDFRRALAFADAHVPQWERIIADHKAEVERLIAEVERLRSELEGVEEGRHYLKYGVGKALKPLFTDEQIDKILIDPVHLAELTAAEVSRLREQLAAQTARYNATLHTVEFEVGDIVCWRGDRWFEGRIVCETAEEDKILDTERWDLEVTDPGTMYDGVDMTGRPVHVSQDCLVLVRRPSATVEAPARR